MQSANRRGRLLFVSSIPVLSTQDPKQTRPAVDPQAPEFQSGRKLLSHTETQQSFQQRASIRIRERSSCPQHECSRRLSSVASANSRVPRGADPIRELCAVVFRANMDGLTQKFTPPRFAVPFFLLAEALHSNAHGSSPAFIQALPGRLPGI